jgi:DNA-binding SARP family transcriptional activator
VAGGQVRVAVLGPLIAWRGGVQLRLGPDRQRALLGLLALKPGVTLHRDAIVEALWGAGAPDSATAMVQCYVSRLRRILHGGPPRDGVLCGTGTGYRLEAGHGLDLPRFRHAAQQARAAWADGPAAVCARYQHGLAWWRGDPLADIGLLREHPEVQLLRQQRAAMIVDYADAACAAGEPGQVLPALHELAAADPLDEQVHARLMIALACSGRQAAALSVHRRLSARLDRDLGVRPGPELAAAHDRVLRQDLPGATQPHPAPTIAAQAMPRQLPGAAQPHPAPTIAAQAMPRQLPGAAQPHPAPAIAAQAMPRQLAGGFLALPVPRQLPAPVPRLAGRAAELGALDLLLRQAAETGLAPGLAVITGPPGVGKTALAVHWAHTASARFPDGQLYVRLHGSRPAEVRAGPRETLAGPHEAHAGPHEGYAGPHEGYAGPHEGYAGPHEGPGLLPGLLGALGLPPDLLPADAEAQAALYRSLLAGRRMLLVLDDAAGSGQAAPLLPGGPGCLVLVTSRWPLTGLVAAGCARVLTLTALGAAAARGMLADRLGPDRLAGEADAVAELADVCARLPVTLAAAAAHAAAHPGLPLSTLAADLRAAAPRLKRRRTARPALSACAPGPHVRPARSGRHRSAGEPAGLRHVPVHLHDQLVHGRELHRVAQPGAEVGGHVRPVQVQVVPVERVGLHRPLPCLERGVGADRDGGRPPLLRGPVRGQAGQPPRVHPVGGDGGVRRGLQVGRREAERAAALLPAHHHTLHPVRAAQRRRGRGHVALVQPFPDVAGGDRDAAGDQQRHADRGEVVLLAELGQQRHVAGRPVPEPEVLPHHHLGGVQPVGDHLADELVRAELGEPVSERQHADRVHAQSGQQFGAAADGAQERRVRPRPHHLVGVRVEGDHHHGQSEVTRGFPRGAHDELMPAVHPVEHPHGGDAGTPASGHVGQTAPEPHALHLLPGVLSKPAM